jgi:hypothetical protein
MRGGGDTEGSRPSEPVSQSCPKFETRYMQSLQQNLMTEGFLRFPQVYTSKCV